MLHFSLNVQNGSIDRNVTVLNSPFLLMHLVAGSVLILLWILQDYPMELIMSPLQYKICSISPAAK